jgi:hypothetical protein
MKIIKFLPNVLFSNLNTRRLFTTRWRLLQSSMSPMEKAQYEAQKVRPLFTRLTGELKENNIPEGIIIIKEYVLIPEAPPPLLPFIGHELPGGKVWLFLVSLGQKFSSFYQELEEKERLSDYFYLHGLGAEATETLAQMAQDMVQKEYPALKLRRYSFGYPFCPDLKGNELLVSLLDGGSYGISTSEEYMLIPEFSCAGVVALN